MATQSNKPGLLPPRNVGDYNNLMFVIEQAISRINTVTLVKIISCTNNGGLSPVGFVDVQPLVNQIDSQGNPTPHGTIFNVPYNRIQGGSSAVIIDPEPGDIGMCGFCSRDISKIKTSKKQDNPGSRRKYSYSDGLYFGGFLNGVPTQYVLFNSGGITIKSPSEVKIEAPTITINGEMTQSGGSVSIGGNTDFGGTVKQSGVDLAKITHTHAVSGSSTGPGIQ